MDWFWIAKKSHNHPFINLSAFSTAVELAAKITFLPATITITPRLFIGIQEVFQPWMSS
jgi:hypothetical protein